MSRSKRNTNEASTERWPTVCYRWCASSTCDFSTTDCDLWIQRQFCYCRTCSAGQTTVYDPNGPSKTDLLELDWWAPCNHLRHPFDRQVPNRQSAAGLMGRPIEASATVWGIDPPFRARCSQASVPSHWSSLMACSWPSRTRRNVALQSNRRTFPYIDRNSWGSTRKKEKTKQKKNLWDKKEKGHCRIKNRRELHHAKMDVAQRDFLAITCLARHHHKERNPNG